MVATEFLTANGKRELIGRVADSDLFRRAPKLREFFLYVADCTLENRFDDVRGQAIAEKVFHRTLDHYDVGDTIVRAEARNLRKRLENYFITEGAGEPFVVVMPKGGYSLAFRPRPEPLTTVAQDGDTATVMAPSATVGSTQSVGEFSAGSIHMRPTNSSNFVHLPGTTRRAGIRDSLFIGIEWRRLQPKALSPLGTCFRLAPCLKVDATR